MFCFFFLAAPHNNRTWPPAGPLPSSLRKTLAGRGAHKNTQKKPLVYMCVFTKSVANVIIQIQLFGFLHE